MKYNYYTNNSTHIEDCSNYCTRNQSSGDYTTWYPPQTPEYPRPTRYPNTEMVTGTNSWRTTEYPYPDPPYARSESELLMVKKKKPRTCQRSKPMVSRNSNTLDGKIMIAVSFI